MTHSSLLKDYNTIYTTHTRVTKLITMCTWEWWVQKWKNFKNLNYKKYLHCLRYKWYIIKVLIHTQLYVKGLYSISFLHLTFLLIFHHNQIDDAFVSIRESRGLMQDWRAYIKNNIHTIASKKPRIYKSYCYKQETTHYYTRTRMPYAFETHKIIFTGCCPLMCIACESCFSIQVNWKRRLFL